MKNAHIVIFFSRICIAYFKAKGALRRAKEGFELCVYSYPSWTDLF